MYCRQCPSSLNSISEKVSLTDPAKVYKSEIAAMDCPPSLSSVMKPRNIKQVHLRVFNAVSAFLISRFGAVQIRRKEIDMIIPLLLT